MRKPGSILTRRDVIAIAAAAPMAALGGIAPARAADTLRVGKAIAHAYSFTPMDVGLEERIFQKHGLDMEVSSFGGSAKGVQAVLAGAIDIYLGAGTDMAFIVKGAPMTCVAALAGPPLLLGIIVPYDSPLKTTDDLKGKKIGCSTVGSVTEWLIRELGRTKGWGADGITPVAIGGDMAGEIAAMKTGQVDGFVDACAIAFQLEETKQGRLLVPVADYVKDFVLHGIYATNKIIDENPGAVRNFLKAWFETIAWMRAHKAETVTIVRKATGFDQGVEEREYDLVTPMFSADGKFPPKGLAKIATSFVELGVLDKEPDMTKLYTEKFLPKA